MKNKILEQVITRDFIIIPTQLVRDDKLTPLDLKIYGIILLLSRMKYGCIASNSKIAKDANIKSSNSVSRSLVRLKKNTYIRIDFDPKNKRKRLLIVPLIVTSKTSLPRTTRVIPTGIIGLSQPEEGIIPTGIGDYPNGNNHNVPVKGTPIPSKEIDIEPKNDKKNISEGYSNGVREKYNIDILSKKYLSERSQTANARSREGENEIKNDDYQSTKNGIETSPGSGIRIHPKKDGETINGVIALFSKIFPHEFTTNKDNNAFSKNPTRQVVGCLLEQYTISEIKDVVEKYEFHMKKGADYFNRAYTVYEFCSKFLLIQGSIAKQENKSDDIWERHPISTPEQRATSDEQIKKIVENTKERSRLMKEEWLKNHPNQDKNGKFI